ncbi:TetR family transcriptional regulator [Streptomyces achromogenes]|uniref:TetR family transcriptional regulator n=1 Tax=Streptomyces achromogenes TaxID=67255 RepID=UPI0036FB8134
MILLSGATEPTSAAARAFVRRRLHVRTIPRPLTLSGAHLMARQHRALRTREELIRSAEEVIDDVGYTEASISAIRHRAGVSNGALHFHSKSKRALGEAVELAAARCGPASASAATPPADTGQGSTGPQPVPKNGRGPVSDTSETGPHL